MQSLNPYLQWPLYALIPCGISGVVMVLPTKWLPRKLAKYQGWAFAGYVGALLPLLAGLMGGALTAAYQTPRKAKERGLTKIHAHTALGELTEVYVDLEHIEPVNKEAK